MLTAKEMTEWGMQPSKAALYEAYRTFQRGALKYETPTLSISQYISLVAENRRIFDPVNVVTHSTTGNNAQKAEEAIQRKIVCFHRIFSFVSHNSVPTLMSWRNVCTTYPTSF